MKKDYQIPSILLLLAIQGGYALCQASSVDTIGEGEDFIWGETLFTGTEQ